MIYRYPIYAYLRRQDYTADQADDYTQGFFTRLVDKDYLRQFERERGRFRSFLLGCLKHFPAHEQHWHCAQKRGGELRYAQLAAELGSSESAVKVAVHRLRQRFRECLRGEIARTLDGTDPLPDGSASELIRSGAANPAAGFAHMRANQWHQSPA